MSLDNSLPMVSLLVAMRNEASYIERCLRSISMQDYPIKRLEVFVFDGQSTDDSWQIAKKLMQDRPMYYLCPNPERIQSEAWNKGIAQSYGEVVGIVSAHAELSPDYVSKAIEVLQRTQADMVGGPVHAQSEGLIGKTIAIAMSTTFGVGSANFRYTDQEQETDTVFMGLCKRSVYEKIGRFDMEMVRNQDDELSYRLLKHGGKIVCSPSIRSVYYSRSSLGGLWHQYFQYGYWKVRVLQKHSRQMSFRQFAPPLFVLSLIASVLLLPISFSSFTIHPSSFIPLFYLITNLTASIFTAYKRDWSALPLLPLVFASLHISYGLGFLVGLIMFANRWRDKIGKVPPFHPISD